MAGRKLRGRIGKGTVRRAGIQGEGKGGRQFGLKRSSLMTRRRMPRDPGIWEAGTFRILCRM